jgi:hypothetical protein
MRPVENRGLARRALRDVLGKWLDGFPSVDAALEVLDKERVPCAPVLLPAKVIASPPTASAQRAHAQRAGTDAGLQRRPHRGTAALQGRRGAVGSCATAWPFSPENASIYPITVPSSSSNGHLTHIRNVYTFYR